MEEDDVGEELKELEAEWDKELRRAQNQVLDIRSLGLRGTGRDGGSRDSALLPRSTALALDTLARLRALQSRLELLAPQLPSVEESDGCSRTIEDWKSQYKKLQLSLRNANLQAKDNIQKAAKTEREELLGSGEESTARRRSLQTQTEMMAASESITETLRRTRHLMAQEVDRGINTLATLDGSNKTLKKAETEYKGHRSILMATRNLLSTLKRQDVIERVILVLGFIFFCLVVSYVFHQRIGTFKMLRRARQTVGPFFHSDEIVLDIPSKPPSQHHKPPVPNEPPEPPPQMHPPSSSNSVHEKSQYVQTEL